MNSRYAWKLAALAFLLMGSTVSFAAEPSSKIDRESLVEQPVTDPGATKIVLIAGSNFFKPGQHEYFAGCAVLADLLKQTPGVAPVLALDWPKKPETLRGAKSVVCFFDGADKHAFAVDDHTARIRELVDAGAGLVSFHQGIDAQAPLAANIRSWMGAVFEKGYSKRAHWVADFKTFPQHPITRGVTPFTIDDGWLYRLRFVDGLSGVTPLLRTVSQKPAQQSPANSPTAASDDIVGWAYDRPSGGRSFTFTGCHLHASLAEEGYRRFLVNGILWSAGVEIPASGAPVELDRAGLEKYLSVEQPAEK